MTEEKLTVKSVDDVVLWLKSRMNKMEERLERAQTANLPHLRIHYNSKYDELRLLIFELENREK